MVFSLGKYSQTRNGLVCSVLLNGLVTNYKSDVYICWGSFTTILVGSEVGLK